MASGDRYHLQVLIHSILNVTFTSKSQTALETARKDFSEVVVQAQKELSKFTTVEEPKDVKEPETSEEADTASSPAGPSKDTPDVPTTTTEEPSTSASPPADGETSTAASTSTTTLFSRLQSALPPNIVATVQNNVPDSLKHASENIDFSHLGTNIMSELQRVQGVTRAQAEEYVLKSEVLIRDAMKEAGEVLRDAVKVIPPDQAGSNEGLIWDGTDMWMLPADSSDSIGREEDGSGSMKGAEAQSAVATRAEALLRRLKRDPAILRLDPEADEGNRNEYRAWLEGDVNGKEGGIDGQEWKGRIAAVLEEPLDGPALKELRDILGKSLILLIVIQISNNLIFISSAV